MQLFLYVLLAFGIGIVAERHLSPWVRRYRTRKFSLPNAWRLPCGAVVTPLSDGIHVAGYRFSLACGDVCDIWIEDEDAKEILAQNVTPVQYAWGILKARGGCVR